MEVNRGGDLAHRLNTRLTATAALLAASVATNLVLSSLFFAARQTVLVPMLPSEVTLTSTGGVSYDYLESAARDAAYLFLNRTPDNTDYFEQQLLKIAEPTTYQAIRASLSDMRNHTLSGHVTQTFIPSDWYVDPKRLYVEASGTLVQSNGTSSPEEDPKIYAIKFVRRGASLRLFSFEEISKSKAQGQKVQITPPPAPTITPLSNTETP